MRPERGVARRWPGWPTAGRSPSRPRSTTPPAVSSWTNSASAPRTDRPELGPRADRRRGRVHDRGNDTVGPRAPSWNICSGRLRTAGQERSSGDANICEYAGVDVAALIEEHQVRFTPAERRTAAVVLDQPQLVAFGTVAELAKAAVDQRRVGDPAVHQARLRRLLVAAGQRAARPRPSAASGHRPHPPARVGRPARAGPWPSSSTTPRAPSRASTASASSWPCRP